MNCYKNRILALGSAWVSALACVVSSAALACSDTVPAPVHPSVDIGKMLLLLAAFVGLFVVILTWIPDWLWNTRYRKDPNRKDPHFPD